MSDGTGLGALRIDSDERVESFVRITDASGLTRPSATGDYFFAVLDIYDEAGDIVDDRLVMTEADWNALNSELGLEVETVE